MATLEEQFNTRLSAFPSCPGMGPTTLGTKAVGDPSPLRQITRGRSPSLRTADRVLAFIAACELDSGGARAPPARPGRACRGARSTGGRRRDASPRRSGWAGAWCAGSRPRSGSASGWRRAGAGAPRRHRPADGAASGGDASDERPPGLTTVPERANDVRVRCALRRFGGAHRDRRATAGAAWACVHAACAARAARAAQAVTGATRQSEGLLRVRGQVCLRTPVPSPPGRSQPAVPCEKAVQHRFEAVDHALAGRLPCPVWKPSCKGPIDRSDPRGRVGWKCTSQLSPCHTRHQNRGVAPVTAAGLGAAPRPRRPQHNRKASRNLRHRRCAHPKRVSAHIDPDVTCDTLDWHRARRKPTPIHGSMPKIGKHKRGR